MSHVLDPAEDMSGVAPESRGHLVLHVCVPEAYASDRDGLPGTPGPGRVAPTGRRLRGGEWLLVNDFAVTPSSLSDALDFTPDFRNPCVVLYRRAGSELRARERGASVVACPITAEVFHSPSIGQMPRSQQRAPTFKQLALAELPRKGDLVAIDCEFVALSAERFAMRSDGSRVVTSSAQLSLARVSCLAEPPPKLDGSVGGDPTVFIDDYIVTPEPIVDYLTRFSGLVVGDLDPLQCTHASLVPLRVAYMKLRHLVDRGCVFVGHGLSKDFRVINILLPPEQIIDTVELFYLPHLHRKLSLRYLASTLLDMNDLQEGTHDSIEDARAALLLYRKYKELVASGTFSKVLLGIYDAGPGRGWK